MTSPQTSSRLDEYADHDTSRPNKRPRLDADYSSQDSFNHAIGHRDNAGYDEESLTSTPSVDAPQYFSAGAIHYGRKQWAYSTPLPSETRWDSEEASGLQTPNSHRQCDTNSIAGDVWHEQYQQETSKMGIGHSANGILRNEDEQVCFGLLRDISVSSVQDRPSDIRFPATAVLQGSSLSILQDPQRYLGTIDERSAVILGRLAEQDEITLEHRVRLYRKLHSKHRGLMRNERSALALDVVLYGPLSQSDAVGEFLNQCELYLQDPIGCVQNVRYCNPQSLWSMSDNVVKMTQELMTDIPQETEAYQNPIDCLADLEFEGELSEAEQPLALKTELYPHQKQALSWMQRREKGWCLRGPFDDLWRVRNCNVEGLIYTNTITDEEQSQPPMDFRGGILGDQMGLGKSLSFIALIASDKGNSQADYRTSEPINGRSTLIVVRAPLLHVWKHQFTTHLYGGSLRWRLHHGRERLQSLAEIEGIDVVLTTYHTLATEFRKAQGKAQLIYSVIWHRLILDEAHDIRDASRLTTRAMRQIEATRRWCITGTPIQNDLSDVASLYQFLRLDPYNDTRTLKRHVRRLCGGTVRDPVTKLKRLIRSIMLRRSIAIVTLPARQDVVCRLDFSSEEASIYDQVKTSTLNLLETSSTETQSGATQLNVLPWINSLRMICNLGVHAKIPKAETPAEHWNPSNAQEMFNSLIVAGAAVCSDCHVDLGSVATEVADDVCDSLAQPRLSSCSHLLCGPCADKTADRNYCHRHVPPHQVLPVSSLSSSLSLPDDFVLTSNIVPTKIKALMQDLTVHIEQEKCVVFSFWTSTLDVVEKQLSHKSIGFMRFDGKVSHAKRGKLLKRFAQDPSIRVALMTVSCGAVGIDLTAASRAYLLEPHWNPSVEQQALARVYRMGQTRPVTTVRYVMRDSFEDHVINVQNRKQLLTDMLLSPEATTSGETNYSRLLHFKSLIQG